MEQNPINNVDNIIESWIKSSDNNFDEMLDFYKIGRNNWALFIGHLCIEKLLKAYYIKIHHKHSMNLHNLARIAELAEIELTKEQKSDFAMITTFNISARYDDYKQNFYKKCTPGFTKIWIEKIESYRIWIKKFIRS
ncbi:MAG: HEPN domain-containing protein [Prolixibacteraceae bacterium]|nr:HEPN domain-containing protein [Prolixibacteraceae bacterium]